MALWSGQRRFLKRKYFIEATFDQDMAFINWANSPKQTLREVFAMKQQWRLCLNKASKNNCLLNHRKSLLLGAGLKKLFFSFKIVGQPVLIKIEDFLDQKLSEFQKVIFFRDWCSVLFFFYFSQLFLLLLSNPMALFNKNFLIYENLFAYLIVWMIEQFRSNNTIYNRSSVSFSSYLIFKCFQVRN